MWRSFILFFSCFLITGILEANDGNPEIKSLPALRGFSERTINHIIQDQRGFMWFGTWDGIFRFDGYGVKVFKPKMGDENSLKTKKITVLFEDHLGLIWIGTRHEGLYRFDPVTQQFKQFKNQPEDPGSISNNSVWTITEDDEGNIWAGTENGLNCLNRESERFSVYKNEEGNTRSLVFSFVRALFKDHAGIIWVGTEEGLCSFSPSNKGIFTRFNLQPLDVIDQQHNFIYTIEETVSDGRADLWIGTKGGMKQLTFESEQPLIKHYSNEAGNKNCLSNNYVNKIFVSKYGEHPVLWIGTNNGLNKFDCRTQQFTHFYSNPQINQGLNHNRIKSIFEDRSGVLWLGTDRGVNFIDLNSKQFGLVQARLGEKDGLRNNIISSMAQSNSGTIWVGTSGGGLHRLSLGEKPSETTKVDFISFANNTSASESNFIFSICADKNGSIWLGTEGGGIYRFEEKDLHSDQKKIFKYDHYQEVWNDPAGIGDNYVLTIHQGYSGGLWFGTWGKGLFRFDEQINGFINYDKTDNGFNLADFPIVCLYEDHNNVLWIGTRGGGLVKMENHKVPAFRNFLRSGKQEGLSNNYINAIFEDHVGDIWIGTEGGLNKLDRRKEIFTVYDEQDGLPSEVIQGILEDDNGNLWLSTHSGISQFSPSDGRERPSFKNYDYEDGLQHNYFNNNSVLASKDGRLFFGGVNGITYFFPDSIRANKIKPQVAITNFSLFNKNITIETEKEGRKILTQSISMTKDIELNYNENSFSFEFTSLHFANSKKNKYAYMLEGLDNDWRYVSSEQRVATYTNVDHGTYRFIVKSSNNDGLWSDPRIINLKINPPIWKTSAAYIFYAIIIVLLIFLSNKLALARASMLNNLKMERYKRQKSEEMNQIKTNFFTNISHELRTPLTLILGPLESLFKDNSNENHRNANLGLIKRNTQRLLRLVNQLLDFQKLDSGEIRLKIVKGDLKAFIGRLCEDFNFLAEEKKIEFRYMADDQEKSCLFDKDIIEKLIANLLSNAFKHTPSYGNVSVHFTENRDKSEMNDLMFTPTLRQNYFEITIADNGKGISSGDAGRVFKRFYQVNKSEKSGSGIGLALVKELVELHFGQVVLKSKEGFGSSFIIRIPQNEKLYRAYLVEDYDEVPSRDFIMREELNQTDMDNAEDVRVSPRAKVVLVVEDNEEVREYIRHILSDTYKVVEAINGEIGYERANEIVPDIIVSDVMMPEMDGLTLCSKLKESINTCHIPIILLTAKTSIEHRIEGLKSGADSYIPKPFYPEHLRVRIKKLIDLRHSLREKYLAKIDVQPSGINIESKDEVFINDARKYVEQNISNSDYNVDQLCRDLGMSRMQVYRKLMALTNFSPLEFIRSLRIKRAAQLIEQDRYTIAEITYMVGFIDLQYFRKCFKEEFGKTPSQYLKEYISQ